MLTIDDQSVIFEVGHPCHIIQLISAFLEMLVVVDRLRHELVKIAKQSGVDGKNVIEYEFSHIFFVGVGPTQL